MKRQHDFLLGLFGLALVVSSAGPVQGSPTYTVTDLGAGNAQLSTDANGNGIVTSADGQTVQPFQWTDNRVSDPTALLGQLPALHNAPVGNPMTYGNPANAYSHFDPQEVFLNQNGVFAGIDLVGVASHAAAAQSIAMSSQQQPDGTFGPLTSLFSSLTNDYMGGPHTQVLDLNNRDQVLGVNIPLTSIYDRDFLVYDIRSGEVTHLGPQVPGWFLSPVGAALDDEGRILLNAYNLTTPGSVHTLLLTPDGLTISPAPVPEPTTLATLIVGLGGTLVLRYRKRQLAGRP